MKNIPQVSCFMGKPLTDYTKDELIEIIEKLGKMLERDRKQFISDIGTLVPNRG